MSEPIPAPAPAKSLSASSVKKFLPMYGGCPRKWAFNYLTDLPKPAETDAMRFGTEMHAQLERWLRNATPPDQTLAAGRLAVEGIPFLPKPGTCEVEREFAVLVSPDGTFREVPIGAVFLPPEIPIGGFVDFETVGEVGDHKSIGDVRRALTPESLPEDIAAVFYAAQRMSRDVVSVVDLKWVYYPKSTKRCFAVESSITRSQVEHTLRELYPVLLILQAMRELPRSLERAKSVPCYPTSCDYAGKFCDYATECDMTGGFEIMPTRDEIITQINKVYAIDAKELMGLDGAGRARRITEIRAARSSALAELDSTGTWAPPGAAPAPVVSVVSAPAVFVPTESAEVAPVTTETAPTQIEQAVPVNPPEVKTRRPRATAPAVSDDSPFSRLPGLLDEFRAMGLNVKIEFSK